MQWFSLIHLLNPLRLLIFSMQFEESDKHLLTIVLCKNLDCTR